MVGREGGRPAGRPYGVECGGMVCRTMLVIPFSTVIVRSGDGGSLPGPRAEASPPRSENELMAGVGMGELMGGFRL